LAKKSKKSEKKSDKKKVIKDAAVVSPSVPDDTEQRQIDVIDLERLVELDLVRSTEAAALNAFRCLGKGDREAVHAAAVDAMRGTMDSTSVSGTVIFGDGLKPLSGGIEVGEKLGNWHTGTLEIDLATIPIDGTDLVARGVIGALAVIVAVRGQDEKSGLANIPCRYMHKIAYGSGIQSGPGQVHLDASPRDNLEIIAMKLGKRVQDLSVIVLERDRHKELIRDIRKAGASVRLIPDGDIAACIAPSLPHTGIDVYMGIGGGAEAAISAAAIRCLGGNILTRMAPVDEAEKQKVIDLLSKDALKTTYCADDLARGDNVIFCATGITDSCVLRGVHVEGNQATTSSVVMRARYNTVRYIRAIHDLSKKTIRLRSANAEYKL
jgi:fructose-1,6-bisphosphatase II